MSNNPAFDSVFIIMFENENASTVLQNAYFADKAGQGVLLTEYRGVTHPSQPNYLATIAGDFFGWASDECTDLDDTTIVDLLESKQVDWMAYMEDLPEDDKTVCQQGLYYRKHNPFVSFTPNQTSDRLAKIVNAQDNFDPDTVPAFAWYGPNIQNCGHTVPGCSSAGGSICNVNFAAQWLEGFLEPLLANDSFMKNRLIVLTFDEDWPQVDDGQPETGDPTYMVLLGDMVDPGTTQDDSYTHYNLLATIEKNFNLGNLGRNDENAATFDFLWEDS